MQPDDLPLSTATLARQIFDELRLVRWQKGSTEERRRAGKKRLRAIAKRAAARRFMRNVLPVVALDEKILAQHEAVHEIPLNRRRAPVAARGRISRRRGPYGLSR